MNLDAFVTEREPSWRRLQTLLEQSGGHAQKLGPEGVNELGSLYRAATADLAMARRRFPGDPINRRLEELVGRARHTVYARAGRTMGAVEFFRRGYWQIVAARWRAVLIATALLVIPALIVGLWAQRDPAAVLGLVPSEFQPSLQKHEQWPDMPADQQAAFTASLFTNNIQVTFLAFAGGMTLGIVTALSMMFNGLLLGAVGGLMIEDGNGQSFVELVTAHGVLELSCVIVAGAAGLSLGWAIINPGLRKRSTAIAQEARQTVLMIAGTAPWLVLAGVVEGNRAELANAGLSWVLGVGLVLGALFWLLVLLLGRRPTGAPVASL